MLFDQIHIPIRETKEAAVKISDLMLMNESQDFLKFVLGGGFSTDPLRYFVLHILHSEQLRNIARG